MRKIYIIGAVAFLFASCRPSVNITTPAKAGNADFTNYLAVGNSLTAGYTDGSLTVSGQLNSYPERLFEQFSLIQGTHAAKGPFVQPLLNSDNGYPTARKVLAEVTSACNPADSSLSAIDYPNFVADPQDVTYTSTVNNGQINNIGVPGIRVADYPVPGYATFNPYAARFYHSLAGTPLDQLYFSVNNLHPTFFTMWLGANDVLGYATAGGQGDGTGNALPVAGNLYNTIDITPTAVFEKMYDSAIQVITHTGASGALINIPDITSIPYFTTIPVNGLTFARQGQADTLTALYAGVLHVSFTQGAGNYFMIQDHAGNTRQAVPGEYILLTTPQDSINCAGWGTIKPIPAQYVITTDELQNIRNAITTFNSFIQQECYTYHLAYVDMNSYLGTLTSGINYNGVHYNALVANQIITTINGYYKSTIPLVDANKYQGVNFPNK